MDQQTTSNVIGPINSVDWKTLRMLRSSLLYMSGANFLKYEECIEKEKAIYKEILQPYLKKKAA